MERKDVIRGRYAIYTSAMQFYIVKIIGHSTEIGCFCGELVDSNFPVAEKAIDFNVLALEFFTLLPANYTPTPHPDQSFIDQAIIGAMREAMQLENIKTAEQLTNSITVAVESALAARQHFTTHSNG